MDAIEGRIFVYRLDFGICWRRDGFIFICGDDARFRCGPLTESI